MDSRIIQQLGKTLSESIIRRDAIANITLKHPELTLDDAYQIQRAGIALRQQRGEIVTGYKMGLTSQAKQQQMHVTTPIYGVLTNAMQIKNGDVLALQELIQPKVEPEIAFILDKDLRGNVSIEEALAACSGVCAAMDIIDSRYLDFKFTLIDVVADNCSAGRYVLGPVIKPDNINLANLIVRLTANGDIVEQGNSSAVLTNPVNSLVMLAQLLAKENSYIKAGSIVLSGSATQAYTLLPGLQITNQTEAFENATIKCG